LTCTKYTDYLNKDHLTHCHSKLHFRWICASCALSIQKRMHLVQMHGDNRWKMVICGLER